MRTLAALAAPAVLLVLAPFATADNATDNQYLAALHHGGLCCPAQPDTPIRFEPPIMAINTGKMIGQGMTQTLTYNEFQLLKGLMYEGSRDRSVHPLNAFQSGEIVVVAMYYYAGPAVLFGYVH